MVRKVLVITACLVFAIILQGCSDSSIDLVKNGNFLGYPNATIGKILDGSFSSTKWSSQETSKGEIRVLFEGTITRKMHNTLKEAALRFVHADVSKGINNIDPFTLHARTAGVLPMIIGEDKTGRSFMGDYRQDCLRQLNSLQENTPPWTSLQNECAETLRKAIDEAFDELYWKEGDTVFFEWVIHSNGKNFEVTRFGAATMPTGLSLDRALKAIYSVE